MSRIRALLLTTACLASLPGVGHSQAPAQNPAQPPAPPGRDRAHAVRPAAARGAPSRPAPTGEVITAINVTGNERIEAGTIQSYMLIQPGDRYDADRVDRSLKTLYATGLFRDVSITRQGSALAVKVVENPIINQIVFEGNHAINDETLRQQLSLRPRSVFTPELAQADRQKILDAYAKRGRFGATAEPKIIRIDQNRVNVVFDINEGRATLISRISFVGNHAFSESRLREIVTSREEAFYRFLSNSDVYDPQRVDFDKELLRRFYLRNGYADFEVRNATAELAPDRSSFFVTFTVSEGEQYTVNSIQVDSRLPNVPGDSLLPYIEQEKGEPYDGEAVERSITTIQDALAAKGQNFVSVRPRVARDKAKHTIDLVFDVTEGPRVYVERIDITGNTRTQDRVVRREMQLAEGDAFNSAAVRRSRQRLTDLGYFNTVNITSAPGSSSDKVVVNTVVDEKATGELSIGGGFSTDAGALLSAGLREKNLVGTGIDSNLSGVLAQKETSIDLSVTDPYFLDQNLVTGFDVFRIDNNNQSIAQYSERRTGGSLRLGYQINEHLSQAITYSIVDRNVYNVASDASLIIQNFAGGSLLSQVGQTLTLDYRDSRNEPHTGFVIRYGIDVAGLGGTAHYVRNKIDGTYFIPLDRFTGNSDWGISVSGGGGYLFNLGNHTENLVDRFFLGGDNLRGFQSAGAGPHSLPVSAGGIVFGSDSVGGRLIYTQSTELHFPLPISSDLGLAGRAFVDAGGLAEVSTHNPLFAYNFYGQPIQGGVNQSLVNSNNLTPRVGAGVGVSWKTPFGLINIDLAQAIIKKHYDQTQFFRFGFGTRF